MFAGSDGQVHLVYELLLTNALSVPVDVRSVEVLDAVTGAPLQSLDGDALLASMTPATTPETPAVALPPASIGAVWLDVPLASAGSVRLAAVTHRLGHFAAAGRADSRGVALVHGDGRSWLSSVHLSSLARR